MTIFWPCACTPARRQAGRTTRAAVAARNVRREVTVSMWCSSDCCRLLDLQVEDLFCVVLEDHLLVRIGQPLDRLDRDAHLVEPAPGPRVFDGTDAWPLGAEQAPVDTDRLEQQLEGILRIEHRVVIEIPHLLGESRPLATQRARLEPGVLIRD